MSSQFTNNYDVEEVGDQAQMIRRDKILNQLSEHAQTTNFLQETGAQVKNIAQGAADRGKGAAQGAVSLALGAAQGAATMAQGAAEAVKNTLGLSPRSANKEANQHFKPAADSSATGNATNPTTTTVTPNNPNDSRV